MSPPDSSLPSGAVGGAVIYALDPARMARFYASVTDLNVIDTQTDHIVLEGGPLQLVILRIPAALACTIEAVSPAHPREQTAIKPVFPVADLAHARRHAMDGGGRLNDAQREWRFRNTIVCDGCDPEGNVFQLRQACPQPTAD